MSGCFAKVNKLFFGLFLLLFPSGAKCQPDWLLNAEWRPVTIYSLTSGDGKEIAKYNAYAPHGLDSAYSVALIGGSWDSPFIQLVPLQGDEYLSKQEVNLDFIFKTSGREARRSPINIMSINGLVNPSGLLTVFGRLFILSGEFTALFQANPKDGYYHAVTPLPSEDRIATLYQKLTGQAIQVFDLKSGKRVDYELNLGAEEVWPAQQLVWLSGNQLISVLRSRSSPAFKIIRLTNDGAAVKVAEGTLEQGLLIFNNSGELELFSKTNQSTWLRSQVWPVLE